MTLPDIVNATFEASGGLFVALSIRRVLADKRVAGVSLIGVAFFTAWGVWNVYFYPHVGAWLSGLAAVGVCIANAAWLSLLVYYSKHPGGVA